MSIQPSTNKPNSIVETTGLRGRTYTGSSTETSTVGQSFIKAAAFVAVEYVTPIAAQVISNTTNSTDTANSDDKKPNYWVFCPIVLACCIGAICCCCSDDKKKSSI